VPLPPPAPFSKDVNYVNFLKKIGATAGNQGDRHFLGFDLQFIASTVTTSTGKNKASYSDW
jgi:hypothetical protein